MPFSFNRNREFLANSNAQKLPPSAAEKPLNLFGLQFNLNVISLFAKLRMPTHGGCASETGVQWGRETPSVNCRIPKRSATPTHTSPGAGKHM